MMYLIFILSGECRKIGTCWRKEDVDHREPGA